MSKYLQQLLLGFLFCLSACQTGPGVFEVDVQPAPSAAPREEPVPGIVPVVRAILSGNIDERERLIQFLTTPCTTETGALGGPPACAEGEPDGTAVDVFPILESEGYFLRREEIEKGLQFTVKGLYAVYQEPANPEQLPYWPSGGYILLFDREQNDISFPVTVLVQDGKMVRMTHHFGVTPEALLNSIPVSQVVLPPARAQEYNPAPRLEEPVSESQAIDFSGISAPLEWPSYRNEELGYQVQYMPDWTIDEYGLSQPSKEVIFNPPDAEAFKVALSVAQDARTLDRIQKVYAENQKEAVASQVEFAGEQAILYEYPWGRVEVFVPHQDKVYVLSTDYGDQMEYLQVLGSFSFIE